MGLEENFSQTIRVGKAGKVSCTFTMSYTTTTVDLSLSKATCTPKKTKVKSITQTLTAPSGYTFEVKMTINKPKTKISSAKITQVPKQPTTEAPATTTEAPAKTTEAPATTTVTEEATTPPRQGKEATTEEPLPGEWVKIQQRGQYGNTGDYFTKNLDEYEAGFESNGELWLGLEEIAEMTGSGTWELEVDVMNWSGGRQMASYGNFKVGQSPRYQLTATGYDFTSTLRDGLKYHNGAAFSTIDSDQDEHSSSCAGRYGGGGWWYRSCYHTSLNGQNLEGGRGGARAARWFNLKVKESTMKIRKTAN